MKWLTSVYNEKWGQLWLKLCLISFAGGVGRIETLLRDESLLIAAWIRIFPAGMIIIPCDLLHSDTFATLSGDDIQSCHVFRWRGEPSS